MTGVEEDSFANSQITVTSGNYIQFKAFNKIKEEPTIDPITLGLEKNDDAIQLSVDNTSAPFVYTKMKVQSGLKLEESLKNKFDGTLPLFKVDSDAVFFQKHLSPLQDKEMILPNLILLQDVKNKTITIKTERAMIKVKKFYAERWATEEIYLPRGDIIAKEDVVLKAKMITQSSQTNAVVAKEVKCRFLRFDGKKKTWVPFFRVNFTGNTVVLEKDTIKNAPNKLDNAMQRVALSCQGATETQDARGYKAVVKSEVVIDQGYSVKFQD